MKKHPVLSNVQSSDLRAAASSPSNKTTMAATPFLSAEDLKARIRPSGRPMTDDATARLMHNIECIRRGPLNSTEVKMALREVHRSANFLAVASGWPTFCQEVLGWNEEETVRLSKLFKTSKWEDTALGTSPSQMPFSEGEKALLHNCESTIRRGLESFIEVGQAILTIRDQRLYRETHNTFEDYCREVLDMSARRAYQLVDSAGVAMNLSNANNCSQAVGTSNHLPVNEAQARVLAALKPDLQRKVLAAAEAVAATSGKKVTAALLKKTAQGIAAPSAAEASNGMVASHQVESANDDGGESGPTAQPDVIFLVDEATAQLIRLAERLQRDERASFWRKLSEAVRTLGRAGTRSLG